MEAADSRSDNKMTVIGATPAQVYATMRHPARIDCSNAGHCRLTMHGPPDGKDYPNESRLTRLVPDRVFAIEHLNGHHFILTIELESRGAGTEVRWRQTFDTAEHHAGIAEFATATDAQNLERLAAEVRRGGSGN